jgi:serine/threonine protein phosphatase PrpC
VRFLAGFFRSRTDPSTTTSEIRLSGQSHAGRVRPTNQDSVYFTQSPLEGGGSRAFALVADGMGGVEGGSVASEIAAQIVPQVYLKNRGDPAKALQQAMQAASKEIYRRSQRDQPLAGMGTTCVALDVRPPFAWAAWVGDSRIYLIREHQIYQMSEDHSVVRELVRRGLLTSEAASDHEERNLVTRVLGGRRVEVAAWTKPFPVRPGDRFLLSTDGLHDPLSEAEMLSIASDESIENACLELVRAANERGGYDNMSAVLVECC